MKAYSRTVFGTAIALLLFLGMMLIGSSSAIAYSRTFYPGTIILPADSCWQPNTDPAIVPRSPICDPNKNDKSIFQLYGLLYALLDIGDLPDQCKNSNGSVPQQKALFGFCKQIKVYWMIDPKKTSSQGVDLTITSTNPKADTDGIVTVYNSPATAANNLVTPKIVATPALLKAGSTTQDVTYSGGPFVIDVNDITDAEFTIIKNKFPSVKMHRSNVIFDGNVDKVLVGKPPKVAVLDEGQNVAILENYIRASGLTSWKGTVFQTLTAADILNGCLQDPLPTSCTSANSAISSPFQQLWAPHWVVEEALVNKVKITDAQQVALIGKMRSFLERGNGGFFECASIGSVEGDKTNPIGLATGTSSGFLTGISSTDSPLPRIESNGGLCKDSTCTSKMVVEQPPFWLTQCGGWDYKATSGLIYNMRPNYSKVDYPSTIKKDRNGNYIGTYGPFTRTKANTYLTTDTISNKFVGGQMTRFVHDDPANVSTGTTTYKSGVDDDKYYMYDYLVGGNINGSPNQGYVVYLPGHSYITCASKLGDTVYPPVRVLELKFDKPLPNPSTLKIEVVHANCTKGSSTSPCPVADFNIATGQGGRSLSSIPWLDVNTEFATYDPDTFTLSGVQLSSSYEANTTTTDLKLNDIYVTFDGSSGTIKLKQITDVTDPAGRITLCTPNATSEYSSTLETPVQCGAYGKASNVSFVFSSDLKATGDGKINIKLPIKSSTNFVTADFDINTSVGTIGTFGDLNIDASNAIYDASTFTLSNVVIENTCISGCSDITLSDLQVTFPSTATLNLVYNNTTDVEICSPNHVSPAYCSSAYAPTVAEYFINTSLYFASLTPPANTKIALKYTCSPGCTGNTVSAQRGNISTDSSDLVLDFKNIALTNSNKTLSNIRLTNKDANKTITLTAITITYTGSTTNNATVTYTDTTNNTVIKTWSTKSNPPANTVINYAIPKPAPAPPPASTWSYVVPKGLCSYYISPYLSSCDIQWTGKDNGGGSNTCGIKYVLNTLMALKFQIVSSEYTKTQPIVKDNILYKASYDYPLYRGHLKMIKVPTDTQSSPVTVWDASDAMPEAGTGSFPTAPLAATDTTSPRYIFTTASGSTTPIAFDPSNAATLMSAMGASTEAFAKTWINTIRGRLNASDTNKYTSFTDCTTVSSGGTDGTYGCDQDSRRLWAIENSTPALKTMSKYVESTATKVTETPVKELVAAGKDRRDRIVFAGADDGMLHAFWAGSLTTDKTTYPSGYTNGTGKEIWAYIPSALLSNLLKQKNFINSTSGTTPSTPEIAIDASPALGDFLVCTDKNSLTNTCNKWEWKTRLVGTASIRNVNKGIVFALDVTDPYDPKVLWEKTYDNMGQSKGVAIGTAQIGDVLKDYVFFTSSWNEKKTYTKNTNTPCSPAVAGTCIAVQGVTVYALDVDTGEEKWNSPRAYDSDNGSIVDAPAVPALMDKDNNGSYDYVVYGDMQGRIWALRTTDGKNLTGESTPVYEVKILNADGTETTTKAGYKEPIGASVSVYRDYVVLGTGGADYASNGASDAQKYRIEVIKIGLSGASKVNSQSVVLEGYDSTSKMGSEQIWAKPAITSDLKVYVGTIRSYQSGGDVSKLESTGRVIVLDLKTLPGSGSTPANVSYVGGVSNQWHDGGFVGGFDFDNKHAYIISLKPAKDVTGKNVDILQIGSQTDFTKTANKANPYKILWWRKM